MATPYEIQQAEEQRKAAEAAKLKATTGTVTQLISNKINAPTNTNIFAQAIDLFGGLALGITSFLNSKDDAKRREQIAERQKLITQSVDRIAAKLRQAGFDLIDSGMNPLTPEFEKQLYNALYQDYGYKGNCNLTAWVPGPDKIVWFEMTNNGTVLVPTPNLKDPPSDFQTYWSTKCRGVRTDWLKVYQDKLVREGRLLELQQLQVSKNKQTLFFQVIFGLIFSILIVMFAMNLVRMK